MTNSFALPQTPITATTADSPPKDWPHAPVHRLSENGVYIVSAGTLHKIALFDTPDKRSIVERLLLSLARQHDWQLEAWAVFTNHYHFVARDNPGSSDLRKFITCFHANTAREINRLDKIEGRVVWHNFWESRLTYQHAYLARLNYVHQNAVKHKLVAVANQYPWCSATWFERVASAAQIKTIYGVKIDRVNVVDDF